MTTGIARGSLIGATVGGFEVETLIGRGAMGTVYLARDKSLNRRVALKVLLGSLAQSRTLVKQFLQEAQAAAPLNHPNIVRIYSAGVVDGTPYIAMEFVDGEPLENFMRRKGRLKWQIALHIGQQISLALDCAHRNGVVHRDVKPSNVMIDQKGNVRLTDFGIAEIQRGPGGASTVVGTPQYMSPEQCTGRVVGPRSDLFSLGVLLFQMMSGDLPFRGESNMALIKSICTDDPPRLNKIDPVVPDDVARFVAYLIEKGEGDRPDSARVASAMIRRLQDQRGEVSAITESITAFLREQAEIRPFGELPASARKKPARRKSTAGTQRAGPWSAVAAALILICVGAAAFAAPVLSGLSARQDTYPARYVPGHAFRSGPGGSLLVTLGVVDFHLTDLRWASDSAGLLVEQAGAPDSLNAGARGLLFVDVAERTVSELAVPTQPLLARSGQMEPVLLAVEPDPARVQLPDTSNEVVLTNMYRPRHDDVVTLLHPIGKPNPFPRILFRSSPKAWINTGQTGLLGVEYASAVLGPDGSRVAFVLFDTEVGYSYIAESKIRGDALSEPVRRTRPGSSIRPRSLQYTQDASRIVYGRRAESGAGQLWSLPSGSTRMDGDVLVSDVIEEEYSISPSGERLIAHVRTADAERGLLRVVSVRSRQALADFPGSGVSTQAWLPLSDAVVVAEHVSGSATTKTRDAAFRLVLRNVRDEGQRDGQVLVSGVAGPVYAVSPDGERLAAAVYGAEAPTLAVFDLPSLVSSADHVSMTENQ